MKFLLVPVGLLTLAGCNMSSLMQFENYVEVYTPNHRLQCQSNGLGIEETQERLTQVGVKIHDSKCASMKGMVYLQGCGMPGGYINVHRIYVGDLARAEQQGFLSVERLQEGYQVEECLNGPNALLEG